MGLQQLYIQSIWRLWHAYSNSHHDSHTDSYSDSRAYAYTDPYRSSDSYPHAIA